MDDEEEHFPTDSACVEGLSVIYAVYTSELLGGQRSVWELVLNAEQATNHYSSTSVWFMPISSAYDDSNLSTRRRGKHCMSGDAVADTK